jgi:predicted unusual protein kinase regulating ubiquinone biosynthesis (AarF/ABC1/UbiB family)
LKKASKSSEAKSVKDESQGFSQKQLDKIKSSPFLRSLSIAKMTLSTGKDIASHGLSTLFSSQEAKNLNWTQLLKSQASNLTSELGQLKGSIMKAGQMLSMYGEHFFPPEANELLKSLQSQSPSLKWQVIEPLILQQLGPEKFSELTIDPTPIGSASMGQVHSAVIKSTGQRIALKIQYPNLDQAIDSDLSALKHIFSLLKILPRGKSMDHVFKEVRTMLIQELNYKLEAEQTQLYHQRLKDDARFVVPFVHERYCGDKLIATSYESGLRDDDPIIKSLPQSRRNKISTYFLDLYFKELFDWGVVQTDPHLGNYRIRLSPDGRDQLVLFDFGAVRSYPPSFLEPYHRMVKAAFENNLPLLEQASKDLKFIQDGDDPELKAIFEKFCLSTVEPFLEYTDPRNTKGGFISEVGDYDWKKSDLPQRLTSEAFQMIRKFELRPPPQEILFLDRKTGGVFIFCAVLGAVMNSNALIKKYLDKVPDRPKS